jgi:hypothetical protein
MDTTQYYATEERDVNWAKEQKKYSPCRILAASVVTGTAIPVIIYIVLIAVQRHTH